MTRKDLKKSKHLNASGTPRVFSHHPIGCHGYNVSKYYKGATPKGTAEKCDDNVAVVRFGPKLLFQYIFRPWAYTDLKTAVRPFAIVFNDLDLVVYNQGLESLPLASHTSILNFGKIRDEMKGSYPGGNEQSGAINGMFKTADHHSCMPGIPDYEAKMLLYFLLQHCQNL